MCELTGIQWAMVQQWEGEFVPRVTSCGNFLKLWEMNDEHIWMFDSKDRVSATNYVTITMRKSQSNWQNGRDSNVPEWNRVVKELMRRGKNVLVMEDKEENSIPLRHRLALYLNADMNLGVSTGPMMLCLFSRAPYMTFKMVPEVEPDRTQILEGFEIGEFPLGSQLPWAHKKQRLVWEMDTYDNIMRHYDEVMQEAA